MTGQSPAIFPAIPPSWDTDVTKIGCQRVVRHPVALLFTRRAGATPCRDCLVNLASSLADISSSAKLATALQLAGLSSIRRTQPQLPNMTGDGQQLGVRVVLHSLLRVPLDNDQRVVQIPQDDHALRHR